jgi:hypothetical protein
MNIYQTFMKKIPYLSLRKVLILGMPSSVNTISGIAKDHTSYQVYKRIPNFHQKDTWRLTCEFGGNGGVTLTYSVQPC